jgi:hypothetical protein
VQPAGVVTTNQGDELGAEWSHRFAAEDHDIVGVIVEGGAYPGASRGQVWWSLGAGQAGKGSIGAHDLRALSARVDQQSCGVVRHGFGHRESELLPRARDAASLLGARWSLLLRGLAGFHLTTRKCPRFGGVRGAGSSGG